MPAVPNAARNVMTTKQKIEELEKRIKELEARPAQTIIAQQPYAVPYWPTYQPVYPFTVESFWINTTTQITCQE